MFCVTLFCPNITITIRPQLSPRGCLLARNHTTIKTRISRLGESLLFSVYFPILSKRMNFFSPRIRFGTCKLRPFESTVQLNSLGRPK